MNEAEELAKFAKNCDDFVKAMENMRDKLEKMSSKRQDFTEEQKELWK